MILRTCIGCGCDDENACRDGCHWAHEAENAPLGICSSCADEIEVDELEGAALDWRRDYEGTDDDDSCLILPGDPEFDDTLRR
jgi:hypothetical protein